MISGLINLLSTIYALYVKGKYDCYSKRKRKGLTDKSGPSECVTSPKMHNY